MDAHKKAPKKTTKKGSDANKHEERKEPVKSATESKDFKTAKLIYDSQLTVKITYKRSDQDSLTCGWLLQEAVKCLNILCEEKNLQRDYSSFIALRTKQKNIQLDYWLSLPEKSLSQLPDSIVLLPFHSTKPSAQNRNGQVTQNDFEILSILAEGSTCDVFIARKKDTAKIYAIKRIGKKVLSSFDKTSTVVRRELAALKKLNSNFTVKLHYTYQTNNYYFFVLDYLPGGDLFFHLTNQKKLTESAAKFYVSELLVGLKEIHLRNIIYRDLKPENALIDIDGHACLADFGLAKEVDDLKSLQNSHCGTLEYMAPELAAKKPYTHVVDFYSLGVVAYELLVGRTPFKCKSSDKGEFSELIQKKEPSIPAKFSSELKDFLSTLLQKDPSKRLGAQGGVDQVMNHPWLADMDFKKLANKEIPPPLSVDMSQLNLVLSELDLDKECEDDEENSKAGRSVRRLSRFSFSEDTPNGPSKDVAEETKEPEVQIDQNIQSPVIDCPMLEISKNKTRKNSKEITNNATIVNEKYFETLTRRSRFSSCELPFTETQDPLMISAAPVV